MTQVQVNNCKLFDRDLLPHMRTQMRVVLAKKNLIMVECGKYIRYHRSLSDLILCCLVDLVLQMSYPLSYQYVTIVPVCLILTINQRWPAIKSTRTESSI